MVDYASRMESEIIKHLSQIAEMKTEHLVINTQMPDQMVHWHRGYIAALRDLAIFITKDLKKKLNEE